jgi:predicted nucleic acid-binding protein
LIHYLDTSALVKRYIEEPGASQVSALFRRGPRLAVSRLAEVEACAALARRVRDRTIPAALHLKLRAMLAEDLEFIRVVEVTERIAGSACDLCAKHPLRAYDAIHLSTALYLRDRIDPDVCFVCSDRTLARIAHEIGLDRLVPGA